MISDRKLLELLILAIDGQLDYLQQEEVLSMLRTNLELLNKVDDIITGKSKYEN